MHEECGVKLFISYRREETQDLAREFFNQLSHEFGKQNIFYDHDTIRTGSKWKARIELEAKESDVMVVLIGKNWTSCTDKETGTRRLFDPDDVVRRYELETARDAGSIIFPVRVQGADIPNLNDLPKELHWLLDLHYGLEVRSGSAFDRDVTHVIEKLREEAMLIKSTKAKEQAQASPIDDATLITCANEKCKKRVLRTDEYCKSCGESVWADCPRCQKRMALSQVFCSACPTDMPKARERDANARRLMERFNSVRSSANAVEALRIADELLIEVDAALLLEEKHPILGSLQKLIRAYQAEGARAAANSEMASKRYGRAALLFERLLAIDSNDPEANSRLRSIRDFRDNAIRDINRLIDTGEYQKAIERLTTLKDAFPENADIAILFGEASKTYQRIKELLKERGVETLLAHRKIVELDSQIKWLLSKNVKDDSLTETITTVRRKLDYAHGTVNEANVAIRAGDNIKAAELARTVLEIVADHPEANKIIDSSHQVNQCVQRLDESAELGRWIAANELLKDVERQGIIDPRLTDLKVEIKSTISDIDFNLILFGIIIIALISVRILGLTWLADKILPDNPDRETFFFYLWVAGSIMAVLTAIGLMNHRVQMIRRLIRLIVPKRRSAAIAGDAVVNTQTGTTQTKKQVSTSLRQDYSNSNEQSSSHEEARAGQDSSKGTTSQPGEPLNETELRLRVENTVISTEWLAFGSITAGIWSVGSEWLAGKIGVSWWSPTVLFLLPAILFAFTSLYVSLFQNSRKTLLISAGSVLVVLLGSLVISNDWAAFPPSITVWVFIALLTSLVYQLRLTRGFTAVLGGTLGGILIASPFVVGLTMLSNAIAPTGTVGRTFAHDVETPLACTALIWSFLVVVGSTASRTIVRHVVADKPIVRGIFAVGLAFVVAAVGYTLVIASTNILNEKTLGLTSWIVWFVVSMLIPPLVRWDWSRFLSIQRMIASVVIGLGMILLHWMSASSSIKIALFFVIASVPSLVVLKTVDVFAHKEHVLQKVRLRMRSKRLPVRIEVSRQ
jgi:tetratricopeptide (TPR) repeat protein